MTWFWRCVRCEAKYNSIPDYCPNCKCRDFKRIRLIDKYETKEDYEKALKIEQFKNNLHNLLATGNKDAATELMVNHLKQKNKFYATRFDERNDIYYYNEGTYHPEGRTHIKEYCRNMLEEAYTEQLANRVCAKIEADNYIDQEKFLKRHYDNEICCKNGILNLETRTIEPFNQEKIFLQKIPITFNPQAQCPAINKFLSEILPSEDDIKTILEIFGYCLIGGYPIQKIILFIGEGANGKGQTLELLRQFLGQKNYASIQLQQLQKNDFKEIELFGKLANIGADISDEPLKETAKLKGLSGGDAHNASVKFKHDVTFINEAKMIFSANKLPKTYDLSFAFFRRWVYLNFPFVFIGQEEQGVLSEEQSKNAKIRTMEIIKKILTKEELSGLLNLALDGIERIRNKGDFTISKSNEETRQWWVRNSDSFLAFCWEEICECPDGWIGKEDMRKRYQKYCRKNKIVAEGDRHIYEILTREMHAWTEQDSETLQRAWNGITWQPDKK